MPNDKFYSSPDWVALRKQALIRDGYRCVLCKDDVSGFKKSRVDHIIPRKQQPGLALALSNLRTLCIRCDLRHDVARGHDLNVVERVGLDGLPDSWR